MKNLFLVLLLVSCASKPDAKFNKLLKQNKCEEAALNIPDFTLQKTSAHVQALPGKGASYLLTSAAYGVDVVAFVASGIILPVLLCSPAIAIDVMAHSQGGMSSACVEVVMSEVTHKNQKSLGYKTYKKTADIRCPNFEFTIDHIVEVAECYEKRNDKEKAIFQYMELTDPNTLGGCIDKEQIKNIQKRIQALEIKG
jgi:hypothetical protein